MVAVVSTTAYLGIDARGVEVQCQITPGVPRFVVVGLPDKAVGESRERVRAAIAAIGLSLPPKVITVNLSPADLPKEGSHYDLPIALALLGATDMVSVYIRETLIQLWTPDEVRGRVNAVNQVFVGASNEVGEFRAGTMAALIGTVPAVVIGGLGAVVVAGIWAALFPDLRKVRRLDIRE